ncbi:RhuM family protein [Spirosoma arcticum]
MENPIVLYQSEDGQANLEVRLQENTVWLTLNQITDLFQRDKSVISRHLRNVFVEGELGYDSVVAKNATTAADGKTYQVEYFNLDVIISVGYRVKSKRGTQFRIWANKVLKDHIVEGYTLNEQRLRQQQDQLTQIQRTLLLFQQTANDEELKLGEAKGLLALITDYAKSFSLLNQFDIDEVPSDGLNGLITYEIDYTEAVLAIRKLKQQLIDKKEASELFGKERSDGFQGILGTIVQTFDGQYLYSTIEEQAANLLYLIIKNHPFSDGNKRIGSFMFVWFLEKNKHRLNRDGALKINDNALVALALLVAQSDPSTKELMIQLIMNLIKTD